MGSVHKDPPRNLPCAANGSLFPCVAVVGAQQPFQLRRKVSCHFQAADVPQSTQGQAHRELVPAVEIVLQGICHQHEDFMPLVQKNHQPEIANPLQICGHSSAAQTCFQSIVLQREVKPTEKI